MLRATSVIRKAAVAADRIVDTVTLDHEGRNRRRIALRGDAGLEFLLDLARATALTEGDALELEDGRLVAVKAAPQHLLEIRAHDPLSLVRVAYHIGNRHTPAEVTGDCIYIEDDYVLAEMIRAQGCAVRPVIRPFHPERGAYGHAGPHHHMSGHPASHDPGQADNGPDPRRPAATGGGRHGHGQARS